VDTSPAFSLVGILFVIVAIAAAWALSTHRRRLGIGLTVVGIGLLAYAVWWTLTPG
jgi:hypothetical protein